MRPPGIFRITLALVRHFGHVPHLIRAILRYFQIPYFTDLQTYFSYSLNLSVLMRSHAEGSMEFGS